MHIFRSDARYTRTYRKHKTAEEVCTHTDLTQGVRLWLAPDLVGRTRHETGKTEEQRERESARAREGERERGREREKKKKQVALGTVLGS